MLVLSRKKNESIYVNGNIRVVIVDVRGDKVQLGAQSGAHTNIESGQSLIGTPPQPLRTFFRQVALTHRLPELHKQINDLEKEIQQLKQKLETNE